MVGRDRLASIADKKDLPYAQAVCHEAQRRGNILQMNVPRYTVVDTEVMVREELTEL